MRGSFPTFSFFFLHLFSRFFFLCPLFSFFPTLFVCCWFGWGFFSFFFFLFVFSPFFPVLRVGPGTPSRGGAGGGGGGRWRPPPRGSGEPGVPRAVGARRREARAELMTNTLIGTAGATAPHSCRGRGGVVWGKRPTGAPPGSGGTKSGRVAPPLLASFAAFAPLLPPSLPPPFVFHHLPFFRSPFPTSLPVPG